MRVIGAEELEGLLDYPNLVEALRAGFRESVTAPLRSHHTVPTDGSDATLLLMPAWADGGPIGVKVVTVFPDNSEKSLPSIQGAYLLFDGKNGAVEALLDGPTLTARRTAAASALAADYLARKDASRLLMVGTGVLARQLPRAHAAVRPIREVVVWGRSAEKAEAVARELEQAGFAASASPDLEASVREADIVSCATLSREPLVQGAWLGPGTHLDLVGSFTPAMREADDEAVRRARVFVDTRLGATKEAGDIVVPLQEGVLAESDIVADLFGLTAGRDAGRTAADEITLFKSVGTALEDLAAARLAVAGA